MIQQVLHYLRRGVEALENVTAIAGDHDHDTDYASTGHTHDYADPSHNHDTDYAPTGHTHPYASDTHNHDADYAPTGHTHPYASDTHNHDSDYSPLLYTTNPQRTLVEQIGVNANVASTNASTIATLANNLNSNTYGFATTPHTHDYLTQATADSLYAPIGGGGGGLSVSYGLVRDEKPQGVSGGTFTAGAWRTRDLNTIVHGSEFLSLSNNVMTIESGEYVYRVVAPALAVNAHVARLRSLDGSLLQYGTNEYSRSTESNQTSSLIIGKLVLTVSTNFVVEHRGKVSRSSNGFGVAHEFHTEIYTTFEIWRLS